MIVYLVIAVVAVGLTVGYVLNRSCITTIAELRQRMLRCNSVVALHVLENDVNMFCENECIFPWNYARIRELKREIRARRFSMIGIG